MKRGVFAVGLLISGLCLPGATGGAVERAPFYADKGNLLVVRDDSGKERPVKTAADWAKRRKHILAGMQEAMGPLPDESRKVPLDVRVIEETKGPKYLLRKLSYAAEEGDRVPAYLLLPNERRGKLPAVLCLHQTVRIGKAEPAGLGTSENLRYAAHLAERGYVTLAPDYPSFGDYAYDFRASP